MKWIIYASIMLSILPAMAQDQQSDGQQQFRRGGPHGGGHRMQLTDDQKTCLSGILGEPGQGERPTHEAMQSAFQQCGISRNSNSSSNSDSSNQGSENGRPPGPPPNLTEDQISCLESKLGKFGEGERPTDEAFKQAHTDCGIELPKQFSSENQ